MLVSHPQGGCGVLFLVISPSNQPVSQSVRWIVFVVPPLIMFFVTRCWKGGTGRAAECIEKGEL